MERRQIAVVSALFRYPVKSMLGEKPAELTLTVNGTLGDRAWAVREAFRAHRDGQEVASDARHFGRVTIRHRMPTSSRRSRSRFPMAARIHADDPDALGAARGSAGPPGSLERAKPDERSRGELDPQTIFADVPVEQLLPNFTSQTLPDTFGLMRGAFFDSAPIHILASGSLEHMKRLCGGDSIARSTPLSS